MGRLLLPLVPLALTALIACSSDPEAPITEVDSGTVDSSTTPTDSVAADSSTGEGGLELDSSIDSGVDSATPPDTTPATDTFVPPMDTGPGDVGKARIHEVYVDRNLEGDKVEFVEIAAPAGTPLENLWLRHIDDKGAAIFELRVGDAGAKMSASGFWVVGTSFVMWKEPGGVADASSFRGVDKTHPLSAWGLTNAGGSIQLLRKDIAATVVDVVGYGTAPATAAMDPKKTIEGTAAALPASGSTGKTIGRKSVPGDTDSNSADFCTMTATPGAANGACL